MPYAYQAAVWCDECGEGLKSSIRKHIPDLVNADDSMDWPQEIADGEESDSPENCASGTCGVSYVVRGKAIQCGKFLENSLSQKGYKNLKKMLDEYTPGNIIAPAKEWAEFYGFEYWENPWKSAHDWLDEHIDKATTEDQDWINTLFNIAKCLAVNVDGDTIQELFQDEMEDDDYFKPSGWYSPEME